MAGGNYQQAPTSHFLGQELQQQERRLVGPVQIIEHQHGGPGLCGVQ
ncbi:MAG: hypothetical protein J4O03_09845 [Chloroflexi bacterium]|nr:hypothetical protein [Chloroflexota bacterium]MCI0793755.1 hypothetical protein [Chloroflexota bacterium]